MNTSKHAFLTLSLCLSLCWVGYGQQAVFESASGPITPQVRLTETVNNEFTRLIFNNEGDLSKRWTLATRSGTGVTDFGLYYNGGARLLYNESSKLLRLSGVQQEIAFNSSSGDPHLLITETGSGASFARQTFRNQLPGFWTFAARTGAGTDDDDFNLFYDNGTTGFNIINIEGDSRLINFDADVNVLSDLDVGGFVRLEDLSVTQQASFPRGLFSSDPIRLSESGQGPSGPEIQFMQENSSTTSAARIRLTNATGGGNNRNWLFVHESIVGYIDFSTDGTSILRMNNDNVGINKTNPSANLYVKQTGAGEEGLAIENDTDSDTWAFEIGSNDLGLSFNGSTVGTWNDADGVYSPSDISLKNTISALETGTLAKVMKLQPSSYYYNSSKSKDRKSYGFIAQEVQKIYPDLVKEIDSDDPKEAGLLSMNYGKLIPVLTKAMQEQQAIIDDLQKEVASLKKMIEKK